MQSRPLPPRPMPKKPVSEEKRMNRLKLSDAAIILKNLTGVKRGSRTLRNWCVNGRRAYSGEMVKLEHEVVLGMFYTTKDAIRKFLEELRR